MSNLQDSIASDRTRMILRITTMPPSLCPLEFRRFIDVGHLSADLGSNSTTEEPRMTWNEKMINDSGVPMQTLIELHTLLSNRATLLNLMQ